MIFLYFVCLTPLFQAFRTDKLYNSVEEIFSLPMFAMEIRKLHYYSYHSNSCKEEKILHQKHESFTLKLPLIKLR